MSERCPARADPSGRRRVNAGPSGRRLVVLAALVCALVALAGCVTVTDRPTATAVGEPGVATPVEGPGVPDGESRRASVTAVIDGDTIRVADDDGSTDTVRLVGVDAPETRGRVTPAEFEGVPNTTAGRACLRRAADDATVAATERLLGEDVRLVRDPGTDERDRYDRLLAHVALDGTNVNYRLVHRGDARVYDSSFVLADAFYAAESDAQAARRGLWGCREPATPTADGGLVLRVQADAPGDDRENPNGEYATIVNRGATSVDLGDWTLSDAAGHSYAFPADATVPAGGQVRLYSGTGEDDATAFYWGAGPVWNNDGDTATLRSANGTVVARTSVG